AIRKHDWVKARVIVNTKEVTWTSKLDYQDNTAFHFAVGEFEDNEVVRDIVLGINSELLLTTVNIDGATPAHTAAAYGNTEALKIMLKSNKKCLFGPHDYRDDLAINYAIDFPAIETFQYLFKQMKSCKDEYHKFLKGKSALRLLGQVIDRGLIDVAYELIMDYPSMAAKVFRKDDTPLKRIIRKPDLFYSGTDYNLYQRFVYRHVPIENKSLGGTDTADEENQEIPKNDKFVTKHTRRCLYDVISMICVKLWETTLVHVPHVKHLKVDKVKHYTTMKLLRRICEEVYRTNTSSDIQRLYSSPLCLAVENNTAEAIDVMTTYFSVLYGSEKAGHYIYQLTVLNRSEKIYIFIMNHNRDAKTDFLMGKDDDDNNILHLAGRLAPMHKRNAASGAALQMQRELQWFEVSLFL
ncbi:ankyrin repeat family protein, partial [Tanacetum coccineum]